MGMNEQESGALFGALVGAIPGIANYLGALQSDAAEVNRNVLQFKANQGATLRAITALAQSGSIIRGMFPVVQDFMAGLIGPYMPRKENFVLADEGNTSSRQRVGAEADVAGFQYPPTVSAYNGLLMMDANKPIGQLTRVARALLSEEVQAALIGMVQDKQLSPSGLVQVFRASRGLVAALADGNIDQKTFEKTWRSLFPAASSSAAAAVAFSRLIDVILSDSGTTVTNTTSETGWTDRLLTIPAESVPIGRILRVRAGVKVASGNSTDTLTLKLKDGTTVSSATNLVTGPAIDVGNSGDTVFLDVDITRRALQRAQISGQVTGASGGGVRMDETTFDWTGDRKLLLSATWSVASASNQAVLSSLAANLV